MNKKMNKTNRREFLKTNIGGSAKLAAGSLSPQSLFADSKIENNPNIHPWWVNKVDKPVLAIDDAMYHCFDQHKNVLNAYGQYVSEKHRLEVKKKKEEFMKTGKDENIPGYRMEDIALQAAGWTLRRTGNMNKGLRSWYRTGRYRPQTENWQGSPEKAAKIIKRAARFFGAADTGISVIDR